MTKEIKDRVMSEFDQQISFWQTSESSNAWSIKIELEEMKKKILGIIQDEFSKMKEKKEE